jgi:hypothetical protein
LADVVISDHTPAGMYFDFSSEMPPLERLRLYPCVPKVPALMS